MILTASVGVWAQELVAPEGFQAIDKPGDNGSIIIIVWKKMPHDRESVVYVPHIAESKEGPFYPLNEVFSKLHFKTDMPSTFGFSDDNADWHAVEVTGFVKPTANDPAKMESALLKENTPYYFKLMVKEGDLIKESMEIVEAKPIGNWFATHKINSLMIAIVLMAIILGSIAAAHKNSNLFVRKIAGLDAIEDALGRATEMGRPALFVHGLLGVSSISTIAALNILGRIARKVAEFDIGLKVSTWEPLVMQMSQETLKEAYIESGRPDAYKDDDVFFAAGEQFSYAAAVEGVMVRERPAAIFHFGYFYAEALLFSETGASVGAIQVAGTDAFTQIPFFITTCDYTLIGEELYAASAYLSREPKLLGSLKGQDIGKLLLIIIIIVGTVLTTMGMPQFSRFFWPFN
jgi:hypothetical protein